MRKCFATSSTSTQVAVMDALALWRGVGNRKLATRFSVIRRV